MSPGTVGPDLAGRTGPEDPSGKCGETDANRWALVGESNPIQAVRSAIDLYKDLATIVVLEGPTGSGKEVVARLLHARSRLRSTGRFVALNCATLTEGTAESELFGHVRGAFTGAIQNHAGVFEQAHGGSLLLDEFDELLPTMQAKVLRVFQEGVIRRVGDERDLPVEGRIILAIKRPLEELRRDRVLRDDLYFRIQKTVITLPPLSARRDDIPILVDHFNRKFAREHRRVPLEVVPAALAALISFPWTGNVRELENEIERAYIRKLEDRLDVQDLSVEVKKQASRRRGGRPRRDKEGDYRAAQEALTRSEGSPREAARLLRVSVATLYRRLGLKGSSQKPFSKSVSERL